MKIQSTRHTFLFRFVGTFVFLLLVLLNVATTYPDRDNVITQSINGLSSLFFDNAQISSSTTSADSTEAGIDTSYTSNTQDPSYPPPPPPPPKP